MREILVNSDLRLKADTHILNKDIKVHSVPKTYQEYDGIKLVVEDAVLSSGRKVYHDLPSSRHFRLLEIHPEESRKIQCTLHICPLFENLETYEALSYSWQLDEQTYGPLLNNPESDSPSAPKRRAANHSMHSSHDFVISCNGIDMQLQPNLYSALQRLLCEQSSRYIWADALCIDQSNIEERSQQVRLIGDIYRNASRVIIWLGPEKGLLTPVIYTSMYEAFSGICDVVQTWLKYIYRSETPAVHQLVPMFTKNGYVKVENHPGFLLSNDKKWAHILRLFEQRYFHRLWIVQEVALAREAYLIWGDYEINWEWVGLAASIIRTNWNRIAPSAKELRSNQHSAAIRRMPSGVTNAYLLYRISNSQKLYPPLEFSFRELLVLTNRFECKDARDRIFGLLGLPTTDDSSSHIVPDYSKTSWELHMDMVQAMLKSNTSLDWLCHSYCPAPLDPAFEGFDPSLPSWVPQCNGAFLSRKHLCHLSRVQVSQLAHLDQSRSRRNHHILDLH